MSVNHQYAGFLDSNLLWNHSSLFQLPQFKPKDFYPITNCNISIDIPENEVLGKRIEHFFNYFLQNNKNYRVLLNNLQIFKDKITIGELDFLIKDLTQNNILHVELIYKFYLYDPHLSDKSIERWIGPNRKDSLLEKVIKLKEKQLPLLYRTETIDYLKELGIDPSAILQNVCFFGNLFVPLPYLNQNLPLLNNDCIVGYWIREEDFNLKKYGLELFYIPEKKDWIVHPKHHTTWFTFEQISKQLQQHLAHKKSPLLWIKSTGDSFSKCFVVWW
ncbi:DUF1853 family protein [Aquimarina sp. SS2-1]|uniref:DUF1853 family protein n=1 Tax=Aquimarina besae TaxID=3342247 RepID=UPI00366EA595